jgi:hypothetical protein
MSREDDTMTPVPADVPPIAALIAKAEETEKSFRSLLTVYTEQVHEITQLGRQIQGPKAKLVNIHRQWLKVHEQLADTMAAQTEGIRKAGVFVQTYASEINSAQTALHLVSLMEADRRAVETTTRRTVYAFAALVILPTSTAVIVRLLGLA